MNIVALSIFVRRRDEIFSRLFTGESTLLYRRVASRGVLETAQHIQTTFATAYFVVPDGERRTPPITIP
jgi:hypothetical protein